MSCEEWCSYHRKEGIETTWDKRCTFKSCSGCQDCTRIVDTSTVVDYDFQNPSNNEDYREVIGTSDQYKAWCEVHAKSKYNSQFDKWCDKGGRDKCKNECP